MFSKRDKQMSEIWAVLLSELAMKGFAAFVCLFPQDMLIVAWLLYLVELQPCR